MFLAKKLLVTVWFIGSYLWTSP